MPRPARKNFSLLITLSRISPLLFSLEELLNLSAALVDESLVNNQIYWLLIADRHN